jgi:hypothetical protein
VIPGPPLDLRCPAATRIEGELEGEHLEGFEVTWTGPCNQAYQRRDWEARYETYAQQGATARIGQGSNAFLLEAVEEGPGTLYARREGDPRCAFVSGHRPSLGHARLALSEGGTITGRVEAPADLRLSRLRVRAARGLLVQQAAVREDGTFAIVGLPAGNFRVELVSARFRCEEWLHDAVENVPAGAEGLALRVRLPATEPAADGS